MASLRNARTPEEKAAIRAKNAADQKLYKARMKERGFKQCNDFVHAHQAPAVRLLMKLLRSDPDLTVTVARNDRTGRFVKID